MVKINGSAVVVAIFDRENFSRSGDDIHEPADDVERTRVNIFQVAQVESRSLKILAAPLQLEDKRRAGREDVSALGDVVIYKVLRRKPECDRR